MAVWKSFPVFILAIASGLFKSDTLFEYYISRGLLICAVGDIALEYNFILGLSVFLLGHIMYIFSLETLQFSYVIRSCRYLTKAILWQTFILCVYVYLMLFLKEDLYVPITAYVLVISVMVHRALSRYDPEFNYLGHLLT
jgi:uncharacterized membrane protein YhhN